MWHDSHNYDVMYDKKWRGKTVSKSMMTKGKNDYSLSPKSDNPGTGISPVLYRRANSGTGGTLEYNLPLGGYTTAICSPSLSPSNVGV